ncbi:MAG TPA: alkaline phosphatase D family protein, partial [Anaerolineales bacterium]|nr:alkaline phosphatase D family protein [Anaerolineales bacterium]
MKQPKIVLGPIVGGLSHNSANVWARASASSTLHVWLATNENLKDAKHAGEAELSANDGFAGIVPVKKLKPNTKYYYAVSLRKSKPAKTNFHSFTTFPRPSTKRSFSFMFGSCYLPKGQAGSKTFTQIHKHIESDDLKFGLFLGDQIYADIAENNGIDKIAVTLDDYRSVYAHAWSRPAIKKLFPDLPLFMILDDHEVDDDWRWNDPDRTASSLHPYNRVTRFFKGVPKIQRTLPVDRVRAALKAYQEHQAMHAPKMLLPLKSDSEGL